MNKFFAQLRQARQWPIAVALVAALAMLLAGGAAFAAMTSTGGYQIWADTVSTGGLEEGLSGSSGYLMYDTGGEVSGNSSSTNYNSQAGFRSLERNSLSLSLSSASLDLGTLKADQASIGSHNLTFFTNYASGATISYSGGSLTNGGSAITAIGATAASSQPGTSQFGLRAVYLSGDVSAQPLSPYDGGSLYAFNSGDDIISVASAMAEASVFSMNYLANISGSEVAGSYSASITFTAVPNF